MDNDFLLLLQAKLEEASLKGVKGNLDQLKKEFEELKIKPVLDQQALSNIVKQLESITGKKITIPNIEFNAGQTVKEAQKTAQQIASASNSSTATIIQNEQKKQQAIQETEREYQKIANDKSLVRDDSVFKQVFGTASGEAKKAQEHFKTLLKDEKAIVTVNEKFNDSNALQSFTVNIKRANGEVESLRYAMENLEKYTGKANDWHLAYQGGTVNDASAIRQFEQLEKKATEYSNKLNDLKSKLTGTSFDFSGFENALTQFHNGEITVNQLSTAFNQLKNSAETSLKSLNSQSSSFNSIQQTQNNMRDLPSMITSLETNMNSLKDKTALANVSVQDLTSTYNSLKAEMDAVGGAVPLTDEWTAKYRELMSTVTALTEQVKTLKKIEASDNSAVKLANQANKIQLSMETGGYESKVESLIAKTQQWTDKNGEARISTTALSTALKNLGDASTALSNSNTVENQKALIATEKELDAQIKKVTNSVRTMNADFAKDSAVASLRSKVEEFMSKNGKTVKSLRFGSELKDIFAQITQGSKLSNQELAVLKQRFIDVQNAARASGKLGKTFFQTLREGMSSFSYWTSSTFLVMKAIQSVKGGLGTIKALDDALIDLTKTTTATNQQLEDFYYKANKIAKQLGATTQEVIQATADWSRLGYSIKEAMSLAETTTILKSISPGMSMDTATETIVSTIKAYGIEAEDALDGVASKINIIGNNLALSNNDISEILKRSASAMNAANTSLEKTISLGAAAQAIVQDSAVVGTALKSVSTRIRGIDEETQQLSDDLVNIKGDIYDLTNQKVRIMIDNDTYKDIYTILDEISQVWDELSDKQHADLLSKLFGTRQTNVGAAILSNFDDARKAMDLMSDSAGNAMKEMDVIYSSMDYKLGRLHETFTSVAQNLFKRSDMKTVVDGFTSVMNVIDSLTSKLGLFGSIGLGAGIFAGVKNIGKNMQVHEFQIICFMF